MSSAPTADPATIPYATRRAPSLAPVVWLGIFGLALIGLGGCFLIGVMIMYVPAIIFGSPQSAPITRPGAPILVGVLYISAFGCFAGGAVLLFRAFRALTHLIRMMVTAA